MAGYMEYKDSGIPWLGEYPAHWECCRVKNSFFSTKTIVGEVADSYERLALTLNGVVKRSKIDAGGLQPERFETYQVLRENELVFKLIDLQNVSTSRIGRSPYTGIVSPAYIILHERNNRSTRYAEYYFLSMWMHQVFNQLGADGVRSNIGAAALLDIPFLLPPESEQESIVTFLDVKINRIDTIIAEAKASIEEYKVWKASIIYEAVTKGLDPKAEMKDSGVAWVGSIPLAWNVQKLKTLVSEALQYGANETGIDYDENLPRYIRITDVTSNGELKDTGKLSLSEDVAREYILDDGDILLARSGGTVGKAFYYKSEYGRAAFAGYMIKVRVNRDIIHPKLVYFATLAANYDDWKATTMTQATIQNIGANKYNDFYVVVPPKDQQDTLVAYLEEKAGQIDALISEKESLIADLEAYKKSLIFEVVTGKRKVV